MRRSLAICAAVILAAIGVTLIVRSEAVPTERVGAGDEATDPIVSRRATSADTPGRSTSGERVSVPRPELAARAGETGALEVEVRYAPYAEPADVSLVVWPAGRDRRWAGLRAEARAGRALFDDLPPGEYFAEVDVAPVTGRSPSVTVRGGRTSRLVIDVPVEARVEVHVVDGARAPIPGADIVMAPFAWKGEDLRVIGRADESGIFVLRSGHLPCLVGARAPLRAPSPLFLVTGASGLETTVVVPMREPGGRVFGTVTDAGGPVSGALVKLGDAALDGLAGGPGENPPPRALQTFTGASGESSCAAEPRKRTSSPSSSTTRTAVSSGPFRAAPSCPRLLPPAATACAPTSTTSPERASSWG